MQIDRLLPGSAQLHLTHVLITEAAVTLTVTSTQPNAACPVCAGVSTRVHSHYHRTLADRPWAGIPVCLHIQVRKFCCPNPHCQRRIFAERVPTIARAWARCTVAQLGMPTSPDTLLRLVRGTSIVAVACPRVLGVDDWAFRKGRTYGTVLVDLEQHQPIDLLPDRTAETLEQWLHAHPGVEIISRDRAGAYAEGATHGAPQAIQVADRFHLMHNLREALQRLLDRQQSALKAASTPPAVPSPPDPLPATNGSGGPAAAPTRVEQDQAVRRARRHARYDAVLALANEGLGIRAIACEVHLSRDTIRRFLAAGTFPERARPRLQPSILDAYIPYMRTRWLAGCDNGMQLWREIDAQGYAGSRALVARWVAQQRCPCRANRPSTVLLSAASVCGAWHHCASATNCGPLQRRIKRSNCWSLRISRSISWSLLVVAPV
jgi:transposase